MSNKGYSRFYRQFTQKILDKIVTPQVLGNTEELKKTIQDQTDKKIICYVLQDASLSNTVLIDTEAKARQLPSVFAPLSIHEYQEDDSILALNVPNSTHEAYHYSAKLIRLIEALEKYPEYDIELVPVTVLWGRSPAYEDSWFKALFADAWATPSKLKQALNISLYSRENYIEFHKPISLKLAIEQSKIEYPNFSPAHSVVKELNSNFNKYKEAILGPDLSDRRNLINKLMKTETVQDAIRKESIDNKISMFEAENRAKGYLTEVVSDFSYSTLRFAELALTKLWTQLYDGIEVHNFDTVRELAKEYEIVYTPCHRSHIDYLLLSYVIFNRGLMVPHIAAGINLNLPVVGQIMRGAGAYFIRRTFSGNELYTSVFKEYLHSLLSRNTPLEYFIEGGRSRTGLLLPPKKGMLSMTIQSHLRGASKPIAFIPTYFGYEKLIEGTSYLNELNGKPKEAESIWGILSSVRKIEKVFGQVHVNFGEPVFLDQVLAEHQAKQIKLNIHDELPQPVIQTVNQVANSIQENINKAVVINPISLISLILLNADDHALSEKHLIAQISQYRDLLKMTQYDSRMIMSELSSAEMIQYAEKLKQVETVNQNNEKWVQVAESQKILLSYFSNNILHCFILPALIAMLIHSYKKISTHYLSDTLKNIYPYFKEEFFLKWSMDELEKEIVLIIDKLEHLGWIVRQDTTLSIPVDEQMQKQLLTLAHLSASSLNNMSMIAALLQQYAPLQALSLKELEKMGKAVLNKLSQTKKIQAGYYFDSATLKSFIAILKHNGLLSIQEDRFIISDDFEEKISAIFNWYNPETQQAIIEALQFNEKELKGFKQSKKI
ncbi:glycerol-3-phosphate 1-O-acyltransferase [Acinetobacter sp. ANC 3903]|uniref:glycerol-3-phosphate 1-O-acyltransferase PlsB n=1 Tax=Acinetobacter sp. ANC 3903 TaxID=1977883 RepID=UPI000A32BC27|nr:glycerol-3-phosphate 1-O-acyltransferase PlsB [Acinetobacter sp. ANC 3903]OTG61948.1 glycerol-3-phosphate 1-O-acyltransferase [Acinetobacter sp. ANC 3903]